MLLSKYHDGYIRTGIAVTQLNVDRFDLVFGQPVRDFSGNELGAAFQKHTKIVNYNMYYLVKR